MRKRESSKLEALRFKNGVMQIWKKQKAKQAQSLTQRLQMLQIRQKLKNKIKNPLVVDLRESENQSANSEAEEDFYQNFNQVGHKRKNFSLTIDVEQIPIDRKRFKSPSISLYGKQLPQKKSVLRAVSPVRQMSQAAEVKVKLARSNVRASLKDIADALILGKQTLPIMLPRVGDRLPRLHNLTKQAKLMLFHQTKLFT